jgi:hypothetical protein
MVTKKEIAELKDLKIHLDAIQTSLALMEHNFTVHNVTLDVLEKFAKSNQAEIRELRSYINMGKGGIKSIFVMATFIAMVVSGIKLFKEFF